MLTEEVVEAVTSIEVVDEHFRITTVAELISTILKIPILEPKPQLSPNMLDLLQAWAHSNRMLPKDELCISREAPTS
jgi:hypothetical protein